MGTIKVNGIKCYAHHGCLWEETKIGSAYVVDVTVTANLTAAAKSDDLKDTVDYVHINTIVKEEMSLPSKLLEHVGQRILDRLFLDLELVDGAEVAVSKINPPIGGDVANVTVILQKKR